MKPNIIFQEFEKLASKMDIKIIQDKGDFKGGYCLLESEGIIVVNKLKPLEQRIQALGQAFSRLDITHIYIKPVIRDIIDPKEINSGIPSLK